MNRFRLLSMGYILASQAMVPWFTLKSFPVAKCWSGEIVPASIAGGKSRPLLAGGQPVQGIPDDWSSNGKYIVYMAPGRGICFVKRDEQGAWQAPSCLQTPPADEEAGRFSPDNRFLAYCSNESGRPEIYVRAFPDGQKKWQVSRDGGTQPRWRKDGRELFFVRGDTLFAIAVSTGPTFSVGEAVRLFNAGRPAEAAVLTTRC